MRGDRKDDSREDDETIVNHFHVGFPLLQKPTEMCVDRQIQVFGSYWTGCMSNEEANSLYKYTVSESDALYKWDAGDTPSQVMDLQEMGVDGQDTRQTGGSVTDRIFFEMKYPLSFLQHWYTTYPPPQQDAPTTGSYISPRKTVVFNYYTHVSDDLIISGLNSGQYTPSLKDIMDKYYEMFCGRNHTIKTDFFNRTEDSDTDV